MWRPGVRARDARGIRPRPLAALLPRPHEIASGDPDAVPRATTRVAPTAEIPRSCARARHLRGCFPKQGERRLVCGACRESGARANATHDGVTLRAQRSRQAPQPSRLRARDVHREPECVTTCAECFARRVTGAGLFRETPSERRGDPVGGLAACRSNPSEPANGPSGSPFRGGHSAPARRPPHLPGSMLLQAGTSPAKHDGRRTWTNPVLNGLLRQTAREARGSPCGPAGPAPAPAARGRAARAPHLRR